MGAMAGSSVAEIAVRNASPSKYLHLSIYAIVTIQERRNTLPTPGDPPANGQEAYVDI